MDSNKKLLEELESKEYFSRKESTLELNVIKNNYSNITEEVLKYFDSIRKNCIKWLTICSKSSFTLKGIAAVAKIQVTGQSMLKCRKCLIIPKLFKDSCEAAVDTFANSSSSVKNSYFINSERCAIVVRDYSLSIIKNSTFFNNNISLFINRNGSCKVKNCTFNSDKIFSIYIDGESQVELKNCTFMNLQGKAISIKNNSTIVINKCNFINCSKGCISAASNSKVDLIDCNIIHTGRTAIFLRNSNCNCCNCTLKGSKGNLITSIDSSGIFKHCNILESEIPLVAVVGKYSNPLFEHCYFAKSEINLVICHTLASPSFCNCRFADCSNHAVVVSNYSHTLLHECTFQLIGKEYINASNFAWVEVADVAADDIKATASCRINDEKRNSLLNEEEEVNENDEEQCGKWIPSSYNVPPPIQRKAVECIHTPLQLLPKKVLSTADDFEIQSPFVNIPCGHYCFSKELPTGCKKRVCDTCCCTVDEVKEITPEEHCIICLSCKPDTLVLPCGHFCLCKQCALRMQSLNFNCPCCNLNIKKVLFLE